MTCFLFVAKSGFRIAYYHMRFNNLKNLEVLSNMNTGLTPTLHKALVQKRFARSISGHQETIGRFQDLTVCSIRFRP